MYSCPQGNSLRGERRQFTRPRDHVTKADTIICRSSKHNCAGCPIKRGCCPNTPNRKISRGAHEEARDVAREIGRTPEYSESKRQRKKVEMLFAHLKRILKLDRLRLRRSSGARDEFLLAATAQNLRRMAKRLIEAQNPTAGWPRGPGAAAKLKTSRVRKCCARRVSTEPARQTCDRKSCFSTESSSFALWRQPSEIHRLQARSRKSGR